MSDVAKGFIEGERIAKLSAFTLIGIGLIEILVGQLSNSIGLTADGIDSMLDAVISSIVWLGLKFSRRTPDKKFNFGYLKVESFAALLTSVVMVIIALALLYYSYLRFLQPRELAYPTVALATLLGAGSIALYRALQMRKISKKYNLLSLKTNAHNSIKDALGSFVALVTVLLATLGFPQMDAVGGMIIAGYILTVAYVSIKEASLVLMDAVQSPELLDKVKSIIAGNYAVDVEEVKLRITGPYLTGTISIAADGNLTLNQVGELKEKIKRDLMNQLSGLGDLSIVVHPRNSSKEAEL